MVNKITLIGNLGQDPDCRILESGIAVCRFSMATSESYKDDTGEWKTVTTWHSVKAFRKTAENVKNLLKKGSTVYCEGKMAYTEYTSKEGVKKIDAHVVLNEFKLMDKKEKSDTPQQAEPKPQPQQRPVETANFDTVPEKTTLDVIEPTDDLPF